MKSVSESSNGWKKIAVILLIVTGGSTFACLLIEDLVTHVVWRRVKPAGLLIYLLQERASA